MKPQQLLHERYRLERRLSAGSQGEVYLAYDLKMDRNVAIKMVRAGGSNDFDYVASFRREAKVGACFKHRNVVNIHDYDVTDDGLAYIVMEFVEGRTIADLDPPLSAEELRQLVRDVGWALDQAHRVGLIHRDLKPANIMLTGRGRPDQSFVILDLGIAKVVSCERDKSETMRMTMAGLGTPLYMAPEQVAGESGDARSDIYAFGSMVFELISGSAPFEAHATGTIELLHAVSNTPAPTLRDVAPDAQFSDGLVDLLARCLAKEPSGRPATMGDFVTEFLACYQPRERERTISVVRDAPNRAATIYGALAAAVVVIGVLFWSMLPAGNEADAGNVTEPTKPLHAMKPVPLELVPIPHQRLNEGETWTQPVTLVKDLGGEAKPVSFQLVEGAPEAMSIEPSGFVRWTPTEQDGPGEYRVRVRASTVYDEAFAEIQLTVTEVNSPPRMEAPAAVSILEHEDWELQLGADDPDQPSTPLHYELTGSVPAGMQLDSRTGRLRWRPGESEGGAEHTLLVKVVDQGIPPRFDAQEIQVSVEETNEAPVLAALSEIEIPEHTPWLHELLASDSDLPRQTLAFRLLGDVDGLTVEPRGGVLRWVPEEHQGPGRFQVKVEVVDDGNPPRIGRLDLEFDVREVNVPPAIQPIGDQQVAADDELRIQINATDSDRPRNRLDYRLVKGPRGATVSSTGVFRWTPQLYQARDTHAVTIAVRDDGEPSLEQQESFYVEVQLPDTRVNLQGMRFSLIPAGEFMMGHTEDGESLKDFAVHNTDYLKQESPAHKVQITRPFYLGTYEVTVRQFSQFVAATNYKTDAEKSGKGSRTIVNGDGDLEMRDDVSWQKPGIPQAIDHPVVHVSWNDAVAFCRWLSRRENLKYRLPTEAEWEYACRGGTKTRFWNGNRVNNLVKIANVRDASLGKKFPNWSGCLAVSDGFIYTAPVGKFKANRFGLFDMHGNVWEWCADWQSDDYYSRSPVRDPKGPAGGKYRVARGGCFY